MKHAKGEYQKRYNGLVERYERAKARFDGVTEAIAQRSAKSERLAWFIRTLEAQREPVAEFDERLWGAMVDYVTGGGQAADRDVPGWDGDLKNCIYVQKNVRHLCYNEQELGKR